MPDRMILWPKRTGTKRVIMIKEVEGMLEIKGFTEISLIYSGARRRLYKAVDQVTGKPMALKTTGSQWPTPYDLARLITEYDFLSRLDIEGVPAVKELLETGDNLVVVMDYYDIPSLGSVLKKGSLSPVAAARAFANLADILGRVHHHNVIHKDINPSNILFNAGTGQVRLIDFDSAMDIPYQAAAGVAPQIVDGTFAYMSPEQTGRMNRPVDYRTDFYSFGASLYEAVTGRRPFADDDLGELVHSHLAVIPPPPAKIDSTIPLALSDIIMKCLEKIPAKRYQSARGLAEDLKRCWEALEKNGNVLPFTPGTTDRSDCFILAAELFGREKEMAQLVQSYEQTREQFGMVLVSGYAGVGKTSLIHELNSRVAADKGCVAYGKYEQYNRTTPYSGIIQAFSMLLGQILSQSDVDVASWKNRILNALETKGQILCEVLPELEQLIGRQPGVEELNPMAARMRFSHLFSVFIGVWNDPAHPLVIFLDDLQWIDMDSLSLLEILANQGKSPAILFIGAYRSNEVTEAHPLSAAIKQMRLSHAHITEIFLDALSDQALTDFLATTFRRSDKAVAELSRVLYQKTQGNPLFFRTMLTSLYEQGQIVYNDDKETWDWDIQDLAGMPYADNVVDALQAQISSLAPESLEILILGACIGTTFELVAVAALAGINRRRAAILFKPAIVHGFIAPLGEEFKLYTQAPAEQLGSIAFRFIHDRIQQAAYTRLDDPQKADLHLKIGRLFIAMDKQDRDPAHLFNVVDHMEKAVLLLVDEEEKLAVARLARDAGLKARASTAFADSAGMLRFAASLLPENAWAQHYDLAATITLNLVETSYLSAANQESEALYETIKGQLRPDDLLRLYSLKSRQCHLEGRFEAAMDLAYQSLTLLAQPIPATDEELTERFKMENQQIASLLASTTLDELFNNRENTEPRFLLTLEILFDLYADAYLVGRSPVLVYVSALMARLSMEKGHNPMTSVAYINYASTLCSSEKDYPKGIAMGDLAMRLADLYCEPVPQNYTYHAYALSVAHWKQPLAMNLRYWNYASKLDLASASPYTGYVFLQLAHVRLAMGYALDEVEKQLALSQDFLETAGMNTIAMLLRLMVIQPVRHLRGQTVSFTSLDQDGDDGFKTTDFLAANQENNFFVGTLRYAQLRVACLSGQVPSLVWLKNSQALIDVTQNGQISLVDSVFYQGLILAAGLDDVTGEDKKAWRQEFDAGLKRMRNWAALCPENFRHKLLLLEAEAARLDRDLDTAMSRYDQSITQAQKEKFLCDAGIAAEKAGLFWLGRNMNHFARLYIKQAYCYFDSFGATGKLAQLLVTHPGLLEYLNFDNNDRASVSSSVRSTGLFSDRIDMVALIKASQIISSLIVRDTLPQELIALAMENAGATKGVLLLKEDDELVLKAIRCAREEANGCQQELGVSGVVPGAVINYVIRTAHSLVVDNAAEDDRFNQDDYICSSRPLSICCLPIRQQDEFNGLLYLENDQLTGAFKIERVQSLQILAAQATISLENTRIYKELEALNNELEGKVHERTMQLHEKNNLLNKKNAELLRLSTTDQLTGIYNRRYLEDKLELTIEGCHRYHNKAGVIIFDVDTFKRVNDTYGHNRGDEVLIRMATTVADAIRQTDYLGRWGGEEFLIIVPEEAEGIAQLGEKLRLTLEQLQHPEVGRVTASFGIAWYRNGDTASTLVSRADDALYKAKNAGRNRVEEILIR